MGTGDELKDGFSGMKSMEKRKKLRIQKLIACESGGVEMACKRWRWVIVDDDSNGDGNGGGSGGVNLETRKRERACQWFFSGGGRK